MAQWDVSGMTIYKRGYDGKLLNMALERNRPMARGFEPRGISDVVVRPNGERVAEIDSSRLEP